VDEIPATRGVMVSDGAVRQCGLKFGQGLADQNGRRRPAAGERRRCGEVVTIAGQTRWLWRAVDQDGVVLDVLVQSRRNKEAAVRPPGRLLKIRCRAPRVVITDKLRSYNAARRKASPGTGHRQHGGLDNRAENSHQPTRRRERLGKEFKSPGQAQRFLAAHDGIDDLVHLRPITCRLPGIERPGPQPSRFGRRSPALPRRRDHPSARLIRRNCCDQPPTSQRCRTIANPSGPPNDPRPAS